MKVSLRLGLSIQCLSLSRQSSNAKANKENVQVFFYLDPMFWSYSIPTSALTYTLHRTRLKTTEALGFSQGGCEELEASPNYCSQGSFGRPLQTMFIKGLLSVWHCV